MKNKSLRNALRAFAALGAVVTLAGCIPTSKYVYKRDKDGNVTIIREGADYFGGSAIITNGKPAYQRTGFQSSCFLWSIPCWRSHSDPYLRISDFPCHFASGHSVPLLGKKDSRKTS